MSVGKLGHHAAPHRSEVDGPHDLQGAAGRPRETLTQAVLRRALGDSYTLREIDVTTEVLTHLDTADWRLRRRGIDVAFVPGSGQLVAYRGNSRIEQPAGPIDWPALISSIRDGPVRDLIRGEVSVRALAPFATSEDHCKSFVVLNDDQKIVARVKWCQGWCRPRKSARCRYGCGSSHCVGMRRTLTKSSSS